MQPPSLPFTNQHPDQNQSLTLHQQNHHPNIQSVNTHLYTHNPHQNTIHIQNKITNNTIHIQNKLTNKSLIIIVLLTISALSLYLYYNPNLIISNPSTQIPTNDHNFHHNQNIQSYSTENIFTQTHYQSTQPLKQTIYSQNQPNLQKTTQINKENDDDFQLEFVQTQFQGKQTQQSLAAAAFAKMEVQINKMNQIEQSHLQQLIERKKLLEDISTLQVMIPDKPVQDYKPKDFYHFSVSIHQMILNSQLYKMYSNGQKIFKISLKQHMRAIIRTQLIHNVNFQGQIQVQLSPFDKGLNEKTKAIKEIIQDEQLYYESLYKLSEYKVEELRFCLVVPSYNNVKSRLYLRNLDSIFMQDYHNYHVVYIDDASPDNTGLHVQQYVKQKNIPKQKIKLIINQKNRKALYNIYHAIHQYCPDGQIVGLIDGDDSLLGRKVLQLYNAFYQQKQTALVYSNFLKILTNNKTSFGFGSELSHSQFVSGKLRNDMSLVGTHFMTFFSDVFKKIVKDDLCYDNGTFYDYAYDRAIITPMIEMAYPRVEYLPEITYEYRNDTGINDGTGDWQRVSKIIMNQPAYQMLKQFPFIDNFLLQKQRKTQLKKRIKQKPKTNLQNQKQLPKKYFVQDDQEQDYERE